MERDIRHVLKCIMEFEQFRFVRAFISEENESRLFKFQKGGSGMAQRNLVPRSQIHDKFGKPRRKGNEPFWFSFQPRKNCRYQMI